LALRIFPVKNLEVFQKYSEFHAVNTRLLWVGSHVCIPGPSDTTISSHRSAILMEEEEEEEEVFLCCAQSQNSSWN
jgi:hypothetical protein